MFRKRYGSAPECHTSLRKLGEAETNRKWHRCKTQSSGHIVNQGMRTRRFIAGNVRFREVAKLSSTADMGRKAAVQRRGENTLVGSHATGEGRLRTEPYLPQSTSRCLTKYPGMAVDVARADRKDIDGLDGPLTCLEGTAWEAIVANQTTPTTLGELKSDVRVVTETLKRLEATSNRTMP